MRSLYLAGLASVLATVALGPEGLSGGGGGKIVTIADALEKLDPKKDGDWLQNGAPNLDRVKTLMKNSEVTQAELDAEAKDMRRPVAGGGKTPLQKARDPKTRKPDALPDIDPETGKFILEEYDEKTDRMIRKKVFVRNLIVAAADRGFYGGTIRDPGDTFVFSGELGTWMMSADNEQRVKAVADAEAIRRTESLKPPPVKASDQ